MGKKNTTKVFTTQSQLIEYMLDRVYMDSH